MQPLPTITCPRCGAPNECAPARTGTFDIPCWCTAVTVRGSVLAALPESQRNQACLCRRCATGE